MIVPGATKFYHACKEIDRLAENYLLKAMNGAISFKIFQLCFTI